MLKNRAHGVYDMILQMIQHNPEKRPSAKELLQLLPAQLEEEELKNGIHSRFVVSSDVNTNFHYHFLVILYFGIILILEIIIIYLIAIRSIVSSPDTSIYQHLITSMFDIKSSYQDITYDVNINVCQFIQF